ncbi:hypothetical protein GKZ90_0003130 [Flavobacterium sp. MC2016-06]|jgi:hypothetical protein|uniref:hypothetical protein n=1 Tax=Flavobacterium sp. MC2016-06 TaxID=2676308 RepID=UPI0012BAC64E|nr:hypothetical protein [Flavobacterium sp. MC2016-06]MBU3860639.1 hypothetical protein [Flavobacterium sp. MC2016-06]
MNQENKQILNRINKEALLLVKGEAELLMDEITLSENITIGKANNYFQILFAVSVSIIGFLVSRSDNYDQYSIFNQISLLFLLFFIIALLFLSRILYPKTEGLKGAIPISVLQNDIFNNSNVEIELFLSNRISSLQICIAKKIKNQENRIKDLKIAVALILSSLLSVIFYSLFYFIS